MCGQSSCGVRSVSRTSEPLSLSCGPGEEVKYVSAYHTNLGGSPYCSKGGSYCNEEHPGYWKNSADCVNKCPSNAGDLSAERVFINDISVDQRFKYRRDQEGDTGSNSCIVDTTCCGYGADQLVDTNSLSFHDACDQKACKCHTLITSNEDRGGGGFKFGSTSLDCTSGESIGNGFSHDSDNSRGYVLHTCQKCPPGKSKRLVSDLEMPYHPDGSNARPEGYCQKPSISVGDNCTLCTCNK